MPNESTAAASTSATGAGESAVANAGVGTQGAQATQAEATQTKGAEQGQSQQQTQLTNTNADVAVKKPEATPETSQEAKVKLDVNSMIAKQLAGELGDADVAALEEAGLSKQQIETLANAHKDVQLKNNNELYESVGGKEVYEEMKTFALENLSDEEIDVYNEAMQHSNFKIAKLATLGLHAMMMSARGGGKPQERIGDGGSNANAAATSAFESQQEVINAMRDPRYGRNQEYTKEVDTRRAKSRF